MNEKGMYFVKKSIFDLIKNVGGTWNDLKERPVLCCVESKEIKGLYWAIPVGNYNHRDNKARERINKYISLPENNIASCYYHIGNTDVKSIFFISDVIPITDDFLEREYIGKYSRKHYVIKNDKLNKEIERKLFRILAYESSKPNFFRQHISDVKQVLIEKLLNMNKK